MHYCTVLCTSRIRYTYSYTYSLLYVNYKGLKGPPEHSFAIATTHQSAETSAVLYVDRSITVIAVSAITTFRISKRLRFKYVRAVYTIFNSTKVVIHCMLHTLYNYRTLQKNQARN